jgi:hypothetical protein
LSEANIDCGFGIADCGFKGGGDAKTEWETLDIEQDGEFVGAGAVGVFGIADIGKLGESAKTIRFASAGRDELIGKPETLR